jgi:hypothetical protein
MVAQVSLRERCRARALDERSAVLAVFAPQRTRARAAIAIGVALHAGRTGGVAPGVENLGGHVRRCRIDGP